MKPTLIALTEILLLLTGIYGYPLDKYLEDMLGAVDPSTDPCEDFHQFACGKWVEKYCSTDQSKRLSLKVDVDLLSLFRNLLESLNGQSDLNEAEKLVRDNYDLCMQSMFAEDEGKFDDDFNSTIDRVNVSTVDGESDVLHIVRFGAAIVREFGLSQSSMPISVLVKTPKVNGSIDLSIDYLKLFCDNCENNFTDAYETANASDSQQFVSAYVGELIQIQNETEIWNLLDGYRVQFYEMHKDYFMQFDLKKAKEIMIKEATVQWQNRRGEDRSKRCVSFIGKHSVGAFLHSYVKRVLEKNVTELKAEIELFVNAIFGAFPALISTNRWIPLNETVSLIKFVDETRYQSTMLDRFLSEEASLTSGQRFIDNISLLENDRRACNNSKDDPIEKFACLVSGPSATHLKYNARYHRDRNSIELVLGAMLEPSFVAGNELQAVRFGRLGYAVGHELMHGVHRFVNEKAAELGDLYNVTNREVQNCVIELYKEGLSLRNLTDNWSVTVSEDIPDIEGLRLAYLAYKIQKLISPQPVERPKTACLSDDQLFFIGYANNWCDCKMGKETAGKHSLGRLRVEIPPWGMSEFGKVFRCKPDSMYSKRKRCKTFSEFNLINSKIAV